MKSFIKILLLLAVSGIFPVLTLLLFIRFSGFSASYVKTQLSRAKAYDALVKELNVLMEKNPSDEDTGEDPLVLLAPFIRQEITPDYIKKKAETLIDDTDRWVKGKTAKAPVISFADLKEKLITQHQDTINSIIDAEKEFKSQQAEMIRQAKENGESTAELAKMQLPDFEKMLKSDFSVPAGKYLEPIRTIYTLVNSGLPLIAASVLAFLIMIVALCDSLPSRLRWIGTVFLLFCLSNLLPIGIAYMVTIVKFTQSAPAYLLSFALPFVGGYIRFAGICSGIFFALSVVLFVSSVLVADMAKTEVDRTAKASSSVKRKN